MTHLRTAAALMLLALAARAEAQAEPGQYDFATPAEQINQTSQASDIRFKEDSYDRMTVPVRLSGTGPYRFLIDTGASRTAISRDLANRLRLEPGPLASMHSMTGVSSVGTATVPHLDLDAKQLTNIEAALLERTNMGADGILGLDSLHSQRILFDFRAQTLTVVPSRERVYEEDGTIVVTARRRNGRLIITHARADNARVTVVIDTGAQVSIGNQALRRKLAGARQLKHSQPVELLSVTGEMLAGEYMIVKSLEIGGITLHNLAVVFVDSHMFRQLDLDRKPALLLGMNGLRAFEKVSIDFARMRLQVVVPEESAIHGAVMAAR